MKVTDRKTDLTRRCTNPHVASVHRLTQFLGTFKKKKKKMEQNKQQQQKGTEISPVNTILTRISIYYTVSVAKFTNDTEREPLK